MHSYIVRYCVKFVFSTMLLIANLDNFYRIEVVYLCIYYKILYYMSATENDYFVDLIKHLIISPIVICTYNFF